MLNGGEGAVVLCGCLLVVCAYVAFLFECVFLFWANCLYLCFVYCFFGAGGGAVSGDGGCLAICQAVCAGFVVVASTR